MARDHSLYGMGLLLFGFALICTGFFLLIPPEERSETFWLDLAVVCAVYLVFSITELGLLGVEFDFSKEITSLGTRLFFMRAYAVAALAIVILGYLLAISFRYQLFFQLCAISLVLGGYFFSGLSIRQDTAVQEEQRANRQGIHEMSGIVSEIESLLLGESVGQSTDRQRIAQVRERIRYLSPLRTRESEEVERQIILTLEQIRSAVGGRNSVDLDLSSLWNRCEELLRIRKSMYHS